MVTVRTARDLFCEQIAELVIALFLLNDIKLWKDARDQLKSLYILLLALGQPTKLQLGILFTSVFPQLIEYNLLVNREPEHNILLFSLQIVTVPSVVVVLDTDHGFLKMILDLSILSLLINLHLQIWYMVISEMRFRHKQYHHSFHELNLILSSPDLFTNMNPNKRAANVHVEFGSDA
ncbi:uncharacterized protein MELLADRAFT_93000 [Melampsora larici-populina 98AG31]|uniref:E3 ubiquitin-protein ligase n=1 Tax=Melampsora larici-populina (strain 98AG31 / pathotype 3-4-7) TaxID=747676 RepID=F4SEN9_MELLP|nr:uncharacterized protein MELLADRAFT_93000 [Melampsora larici-populina 98AG31]EGF96887.1 hypothetical protein MELLADRAFT_93000 [Melampsora larici-populina 98AG31]